VKPIVVLQRFSNSEVATVEAILSRNWYFPEHQEPEIINLQDESNVDARSQLMNLGINCHMKSGNSYLGFLDYDDFLYSQAYSMLTTTLSESNAAVAFASVELAKVIPLKDYDFVYEMSKPFVGKNKIDLLRDNFCPLHSYLIKTDGIDESLLYFRENMIRVEDYEFLIRLVGTNPCDFSNLGKFIGCYVMRSDGSNTTPWSAQVKEGESRTNIWAENVKLLNMYKSSTEVKFYASDF